MAFLLALPLAVLGPTRPASATIPAGFQLLNLRTGLTSPYDLTDFAYTPDNGFYSLGKGGTLNWTSPDGVPRQVHRFSDVITTQDLGALTVVTGEHYGDPGVPPTLWIVRIRADGVNEFGLAQLSEFSVILDDAGRPTGLGAERGVLTFANRGNTHSMDSVIVDPRDGSLWVTVGDGADFTKMDRRALDARALESPYGRVLHIDAAGRGVATNPHHDPAKPQSWTSRTFALGFRNPFRMSLHPVLGIPMLGEVGWNTTEEQDVVRPGADYGWPCWEGPDPTPEYRDLAECQGTVSEKPLFSYRRDRKMGSSTMGGLIYQGPGTGSSGYPAEYVGSYFWADYSGAKMFVMRPNADATALITQPDPAGFGNQEGSDAGRRIGMPVSMRYAPNGDITYADISSNQVRRLTYTSGNHAPEISQTQYTTIDRDTRQVQFQVDASDLDGDALSYHWDFGDGTGSTERNPIKSYSGDGPWTARVTVSDGIASTSDSVVVHPRNRTPQLVLDTPPDSTSYAVGDLVTVSARASDADQPGESLPIRWTSILHHCTGDFYCHRHPGAIVEGARFSEPFTNHGDDTTLELRAETTDAAGVTVYQTWQAKPKLRTLVVTANQSVPISINGVAGGTRRVTVGSTAGISVPAQYEGLRFGEWSDGVTDNVRSLVMPDADQALRASYRSPIADRYASDATVRALLGAPVGTETVDGGVRMQVYQHGRMYWTAAAGVHEVHGRILDVYLDKGGPSRLGVPTTDEVPTPEGAGRMSSFAGGTAGPGPVIYYSPGTDAQLVLGSIREQYARLDTTPGVHGFPRTSEQDTPNRAARYNDFTNGGIYWSPGTGAQSVYGAIYGRWAQFGWEAGFLGLPLISEAPTPDNAGRFNHFQGGSIYWTVDAGAHEVHGSIRDKWAELGWETSTLRFPITDELPTPDRVGRFNHFGGGSVYWSRGSAAHEVHGLIRDEWARRGWERSGLGYPVSDEYAVAGGRRSDFEHGSIQWVDGRLEVYQR